MLESLHRLRKHKLRTSDAHPKTKSVADLLFDERDLAVRYLVADTGNWLPGQKVLISPEAVVAIDAEEGVLHTNLTEEMIEAAPSVAADAPVSLDHRRMLARHYGWSAYDAFHPILGGYGWMRAGDVAPPMVAPTEPRTEPTLRSVDEVVGYDIEGTDEGVGNVADIVIDTRTWALRYLVVDTRKWLPFSRKVLVPVARIRDISFPQQAVRLDLTRAQIEQCPEFDVSLPVTTEHELAVLEKLEQAPV